MKKISHSQTASWGSGIQKMKKELEAYPEIELVLQEAGHAFQVQFVKKEMTRAESRQGQGQFTARVTERGIE